MRPHRWLLILGLSTACGGSPSSAPADGGGAADARAEPADAEASDASNDAVITAAADAAEGGAPTVDASSSDVVTRWRSTLYPADWTPSFSDGSGRFVHDFSYAGYRGGQAELGAGLRATAEFDVTSYGADATGETDSTAAIQAAIDAASEDGGIVRVPDGVYRVDGSLLVRASNVVVRGTGSSRSRLFFSKTDGMIERGHLMFRGALVRDQDAPLAVDGVSRERDVIVDDAGVLAVGDDVALGWTITDAFVEEHGMSGTWQSFNGTWQPIMRRRIVAIDRSASPHRVTLDVPLRYAAKTRDGASLRRERGYLREVGVDGIGLSNAVELDAAWSVRLVSVLRFDGVADAWARDVRSFASPLSPATGPVAGAHLMSNGVSVYFSKRVTIADSSMQRAQNRGDGGNGYLFELSQSSEVLFRDLEASAGRHNFIQNWGFGTTGCVWLRVHSADGQIEYSRATAGLGLPGYSDFHHSLATANLIDSSRFDDGMKIVNRGNESSGAGITGTENVIWNASGAGTITSMQYALGYVIGTTDAPVVTAGVPWSYAGTAPEDFVEGLEEGAALEPSSLYEDQLRRRLETH